MRPSAPACLLLCAATLACPATIARAQVPVAFGRHVQRLQNIVDSHYGRGRIDVRTDYLGARSGDPDPCFWVDDGLSALLVKEVSRSANRDIVGWFVENGAQPLIPSGGGVLLDGRSHQGEVAIVRFKRAHTRFGFYLDPNGSADGVNAPQPERFYTNRLLNDVGPDGSGAIHVPLDGDVQALIFDLSRWAGPNIWLVCFEDRDSGADPHQRCEDSDLGPAPGMPGQCETDNDFDDVVFEVRAAGATPATSISFGALKIRYH